MTRQYSTFIFDLDGTLLDTLQDLANAVNFALTTGGLPPRSTAEVRSFLGNGIRYLVKKSVPEGTDESVFERVFQCFRARYVAHCLDLTRPYAGMLEVLEAMKQAGVGLAIVSNKLQPAVTELRQHFFNGLIDVAVGESSTVRRKPCPDAVLAALRELGGDKQTAVYVGDSEVDIETAQRAELPCVSVLWGFRDEDFLRRVAPHGTFVRQPAELLDFVAPRNNCKK